ncbi:MAG: exodeoxyribonuclease VII large subunit, partial [Pseudomonadales bacterium]
KSMAWWDKKEALSDRFRDAGIDPDSEIVNLFLSLLRQILRFPRHLSQHVGGFVISQMPIARLVPIENAAMDERTVIQWDKDDLDALGLLKVDILALGMLTAIRKCFDLVNEIRDGSMLTLATVPAEDPETYRMLQKGDSAGVFQVESRAQMAMLPRLKPQCFYDLVIEVAIVRPGPIQGNMVHPYLRRRRGQEPVTFANEAVRGVLGRTLGVPIFQEQVIKLAVVAAGFTPGEADQLRRAMAAWRRRGGLEHFEEKLVNGMLERGYEREFAERIFEQIKGFGEYGFPESHAASFALLVYVSAWLKRHEPAAFCCALLNSQPMGFYSPSQLVQDARRHGVEVRDVDVMRSDWDHTLEPGNSSIDTKAINPQFVYELEAQPAIRLGMRLIKGFNKEAALRIMAARRNRAIDSLETLARSADLMPGELGALAHAGALTSLSGHRHQAFWEAEGVRPPPELWQERKVAESGGEYGERLEEAQVRGAIPAPTRGDDLVADYQSLGLTLGKHPMCFLRKHFRNCLTALELREVRHGRFVRVAGIVTGRQRPSTASGVIFMTLEDETGNINVVIWASVLARLRAAVLQGKLVMVKGIVERENEVIHVVAGHVSDQTPLLGKLITASRDFH